jgi:hypothetical protein
VYAGVFAGVSSELASELAVGRFGEDCPRAQDGENDKANGTRSNAADLDRRRVFNGSLRIGEI